MKSFKFANYYNLFLKSALTTYNPINSTEEVVEWLKKLNQNLYSSIKEIKFSDMDQWSMNKQTGNIGHKSGRFFTIEGINVKINRGLISDWDQPIINQPEVGYLGIITKEFDGILYFLLQAKIEPGNLNKIQLSPTLQATKSNYSLVHGGNVPRYLNYFRDRQNSITLIDQLQSEQGARFLQKRNRNVIIQVFEEIPLYEEFVWLTLGQIKKLMRHPNLVNMDTRTVISGIQYKVFDEFPLCISNELPGQGKFLLSALGHGYFLNSLDDHISWLTELKTQYEPVVRRIPIHSIRDWTVSDYEISHKSNRYFKVIAAEIEIENREVKRWSQPLIKPINEGIIGFIAKEFNGTIHFLVQAKYECGNFDILELAPTVQTITGNFKAPDYEISYLNYFLNPDLYNVKVLYDVFQSEEGGRFYHEQNRNIIIEVPADAEIDTLPNFTWMTINQLMMFLKFNNYLNIQTRSLLASISFIE